MSTAPPPGSAAKLFDPGSARQFSQKTPTLPGPSDPATSGTRMKVGRAVTPTADEIERIRFELTDRYSAGDFAAALALAEELEAKNPNDLSAASFARECRVMLEKECVERVGRLDGVVVLKTALHDLRGRAIDHRAGFLLSRVDGVSTLEALLDVCGMPRLDALHILAELVEGRIVRVE